MAVVALLAGLAWLTAGGGVAAAAAGDLDPSFGSHGIAKIPSTSFVSPQSTGDGGTIFLTPVGGSSALVKLQANGAVASGFGSGGLVTPAGETIRAFAVDEDGRVVVVGNATGSSGELRVTRLLADGTTDTGFGAQVPALDPELVAEWVAVDGSGRILIGGQQGGAAAVLRLLPDGSPDDAFGTDGVATVPGSARDFALSQGQDTFIAIQGTPFENYVAKLDAGGNLDSEWGTGGAVRLDISGQYGGVAYIAADSSGRVALWGAASVYGSSHGGALTYLELLDASGAIDQGYTANARMLLTAEHHDRRGFYPSDLAFDARRRLTMSGASVFSVYGGNYFSDAAVARLRADGSPDPRFGENGRVRLLHQTLHAERANGVLVQPNGRILGTSPGGAFRLLGSGKHHDADADGVSDRRDACPQVFGKLAGGCRTIHTHLTLRYSRTFSFSGRLAAASDRCIEQRLKGGRKLRSRIDVVRVRPGRDRVFGRARAEESGTWLLQKHPSAGTYYAHYHRLQDRELGICAAARSDRLRVGRR